MKKESNPPPPEGVKKPLAPPAPSKVSASASNDLLYVPLYCPKCQQQHVDEGEWATKPHHKHLCLHCGFIWKVEPYVIGVKCGYCRDKKVICIGTSGSDADGNTPILEPCSFCYDA